MSVDGDLKRLASLVRQLQGAIGGKSLKFGTQTLTWAGGTPFSDFPAVNHGLTGTPVIVIPVATAGLAGGKRVLVTAYGYTATQFTVDGVTDDRSNPAAATTLTVAWVAVG